MNNPTSAQPNPATTPTDRHIRNAYIAIGILVVSILPTMALFGYFGWANRIWQLQVITTALLVVMFIDLSTIVLIQRGKSELAMMLLMSNFIIVVLISDLFVKGLGLVIAVATSLVVIGISSLAMPPRYAISGIGAAAVAAVALLWLDLQDIGIGSRLVIPQIELYSAYIAAFLGGLFILIAALEFNRFHLQLKITLGILITGAITISALVGFGVNSSNKLVETMLGRYKDSNAENVKREIAAQAQANAQQINNQFNSLINDIQTLAASRASLEARKSVLSQGSYWDARTHLFKQAGGQYSNSASDPSSIFIPSTITVDDALIADLNTTAYFDFYALNYLQQHQEVTAVYYINKAGAATYYPNIELAKVLPSPDFDPRAQSFYSASDPSQGATLKPHWITAYQDPAGQGLLVTLSTPVYYRDTFIGVIGIDIKLDKLFEQIKSIKPSKSGYAILVDDAGHILSAPPQGYSLFGMQKETPPVNESPKQTILGKGPLELQLASDRVIKGQNALEVVPINSENLYFAFAPLATPSYRLILVAPEQEFTANITAAENAAQTEAQNILQGIAYILALLFIGAVIISLLIGRLITSPLQRLTKAVERIASGDLSARVPVETEDETGILARSFNSMTETLSTTLKGLETRVSERTRELEKVNESNARRAAEFESVADVARAISTTQSLETLLPQIAETISVEFNFYHVGIFLMDNRREFAILVASNSEGGRRMLARNHRLRVGETGIVGYVTNIGQPRVALDVGKDAAYFNNPDLPNTRSEAALPLRMGAEIFGALDVQSTEANAFSADNISILSMLADQVSIAIQNARLYQQSAEALAKAESASLQLSGQQWQRFLASRALEGYYFDGIDIKAITSQTKRRAHNLAIPLTLRGSQIGSIKLSALDPDREWTDDEIAMVQSAAERAALALENARLLLESQRRATKERTIGEISARIGSSTSLEGILQTALQELGNTLPGVDVAVQFTDAPARK